MNYGFFCLFCSIILLWVAFVWAFKSVFVRMVHLAAEMVPTHAMAYLKCLVGTIISGGLCFRETWQPVTMEKAAGFAPWDWMIYLGMPFLSMLIFVNGFLDRSLERADAAKKTKESSTTSTTSTTATRKTVAEPEPTQ